MSSLLSSIRKYVCKACTLKKSILREFPDGPLVRVRHHHCQGPGFNPWSGNEDPASHAFKKEKKKKRCPDGLLHARTLLGAWLGQWTKSSWGSEQNKDPYTLRGQLQGLECSDWVVRVNLTKDMTFEKTQRRWGTLLQAHLEEFQAKETANAKALRLKAWWLCSKDS